MAKIFWFMYALVVVFVLLIAKEVFAEESTQFVCSTEESANAIASKVILNQEEADNVAGPYIEQKVCVYLPQQVTILIVYRGTTYGTGSFRVQVVGIGKKDGDKPDFFALMRLNEGAT